MADVADLTVYTTSWCPFCVRLKASLNRNEIPYTEIDVEADADAAAFVESVNGGNRVVPTVKFADGSTKTNPGIGEVMSALGLL
ncbi:MULTISPECIES: mycoredoxin [unclassified Gordonia (in: high G+C Gram-positive bacteria)]|uniref:mycoredoxin n=1 Tax=unclassified Gordonia (in: high G+C Gram-positive bacteria) TaxID=2657482 RepID=UPI001FFF20A8|nr:mycoredoxin [Gordonia sp. PP30]UQE77113.1 mycoredoxin [Gordonia sp. PP30]